MNSVERFVRLYIKDLGLHDKIAMMDYVVLQIKMDLKKAKSP